MTNHTPLSPFHSLILPITFTTFIKREINCMIYEFDEDIGFILFSFDFYIRGNGNTSFNTINDFKLNLFKIIEEQTGLITLENHSFQQQQIITTNFELKLSNRGIHFKSKHNLTFQYNQSDNTFSICPF